MQFSHGPAIRYAHHSSWNSCMISFSQHPHPLLPRLRPTCSIPVTRDIAKTDETDLNWCFWHDLTKLSIVGSQNFVKFRQKFRVSHTRPDDRSIRGILHRYPEFVTQRNCFILLIAEIISHKLLNSTTWMNCIFSVYLKFLYRHLKMERWFYIILTH